MTELTLDTDQQDATISEYIDRCAVMLAEVFFARNSIDDFEPGQSGGSRGVTLSSLLHEAPLDMACRYLGKQPNKLTATELERATKVALVKGWVAT